MFLPLLAQALPPAAAPIAAPIAEKTIQDPTFMNILWHADPVVKLTLLILIAASVFCWAIIFYKAKQIKKAQNDAQNFWNIFAQSKNVGEIVNHTGARTGPLYEIYTMGLNTAATMKKTANRERNRDVIDQKLSQSREEEVYKLEQYTHYLAIIASASPFVGLFGTVWGILTAFWEIGKAGSSSLVTVGPAISEALIATAVGLAAAIPAYVAYNFFVHKIRVVVKIMNLFSDDLALRLEEEV